MRTGPTSAIAIWQTAPGGLYARRTSNGGVSWTTAALLATGVESPPGASSYGQPRIGGLAILDTQELAGYWQANPRAPTGYWVRRGP